MVEIAAFALIALLGGHLLGCSRYVATEIPENCVEAKWDAKLNSCRETMTGRWTISECCGLDERDWCGFVPLVCSE